MQLTAMKNLHQSLKTSQVTKCLRDNGAISSILAGKCLSLDVCIFKMAGSVNCFGLRGGRSKSKGVGGGRVDEYFYK